MKIVCIPLDIRPYNYQFLIDIAGFNPSVKLIMPEKNKLGKKKTGADLEYLNGYLKKNCTDADALIISLDMFLYGGLFPARIHNEKNELFSKQMKILKTLKTKNSKLKIYCSSLILRTPAYNNSLEEPFYYEEFGLDIYNYGVLKDKIESNMFNKDEQSEYEHLLKKINPEYLADYITRRKVNLKNTINAVDFIKDDIFEVLVIPQDDTSKFGHGAMDQKYLYNYINEVNLFSKVYLHPGTDESGCTLLTRAYCDYYKKVSLKPLYMVEQFKQFIPLFEDRVFSSSLISHTSAMGIEIKEEGYDFVLAINGVSSVMHEASHVYFGTSRTGQYTNKIGRDLSYYRDRNFENFAQKLKSETCPIGVLDASFCNGGEFEFVRSLKENNLIDRISGYSGWNTVCNSLGTVLATMAFSINSNEKMKIESFKASRFINDLIYCSDVCIRVNKDYLPTLGVKYDDFSSEKEKVLGYIKNEVQIKYNQLFDDSYIVKEVLAPFDRLTGLEFIIKRSDDV